VATEKLRQDCDSQPSLNLASFYQVRQKRLVVLVKILVYARSLGDVKESTRVQERKRDSTFGASGNLSQLSKKSLHRQEGTFPTFDLWATAGHYAIYHGGMGIVFTQEVSIGASGARSLSCVIIRDEVPNRKQRLPTICRLEDIRHGCSSIGSLGDVRDKVFSPVPISGFSVFQHPPILPPCLGLRKDHHTASLRGRSDH
jgi:hypothetical protein